jgi:hypothetical protein
VLHGKLVIIDLLRDICVETGSHNQFYLEKWWIKQG